MPLVSIITVTFNAEASIEATICSVIDKSDHRCEYLIIDGGSSDGTVAIVEKHLQNITHFISEPDSGIYHAMNKGIDIAQGRYLYFVNAGDLILDIPYDVLENYLDTKYAMIAFPVIDSNGNLRLPAINWLIKIRNLLPHQGCFYKKDLKISYTLKYKVFADFDLNQRIYIQNNPIKVLNTPVVASHDLGGISHNKTHGKEIFLVVGDNFGLFYKLLSFIHFKWDGLCRRIKGV
jgi:glycosyltransferase involved in cell wall biosynthesis